jgi:hypothetical protein
MNFYFPDLSYYPKVCCDEERGIKLIAIGWLDKGHTFQTGEISKEAIQKLEIFCSKPMILTLGKRDCPFCNTKGPIRMILGTGNELIIHGTDEVRIPSKDGKKVYGVPNLIIHFIKTHNYSPPQEFIDAVIAAPLPGTRAFNEFAIRWKDYH